MAILRLDPPIPLLTPLGKAYAHVLIDRSQDHHLEWVCCIESTGECWTYQNPDIKFQPNPTMHIADTANTAVAKRTK